MTSPIDNIFLPESLLPHEIILLTERINDPLIRKYLRILGTEDSKELLTLGTLDMSDRDIANRHHFLSGKLAVVATLLSITPSSKEH